MRPRITCHMITSLDGRLLPERWSDPADDRIDSLIETHYEATAVRLQPDGWIVGRRTMAEYVAEDPAPEHPAAPRERPAHLLDPQGRDLAIAVDPSGRLKHTGDSIDGDHAVAILSQRVSDHYLARLRDLGVSYVFAGPEGDQLHEALATIGSELGIRHLVLEGGGRTNGAFLAARLIDEVSTLLCPAIDGLAGIPSIFDHAGPEASSPSESQHLRLLSCETLAGGVVWLRHEIVQN